MHIIIKIFVAVYIKSYFSDVRLANLLVSLIIDGKYEQALDEGKKLNLFSSVDAWCSKVGDELCKNVHNYVSTSEPSSSIR